MAERYWLDETDPGELRRRAQDLRSDGLFAMAEEFRWRANYLEREYGPQRREPDS